MRIDFKRKGVGLRGTNQSKASFYFIKILDNQNKLCYNLSREVSDMWFLKKIRGMRGCVPDSWWVFDENEKCVATFLTLEDAEEFFNNNCKETDK